MLKRTVLILPLLALAMLTGTGFAQTPEAPKTKDAEPLLKFYKLDFVVKEVEGGKVLNTRSYSMTVAANLGHPTSSEGNAAIRTGDKIPVLGTGGDTAYVGTNIDCRSIREVERDLTLSLTADISSIPSEPAAPATTAATRMPTIRQNRWVSTVAVPLKKPTVIFSSDDLTSKRQMQLELTATPIN
jgi:hypothetical protein